MAGWDPGACRQKITMSSTAEIKQKLEELVQPLAVSQGLDLVDLELHRSRRGRTVVRLFLDREGGITLEEIARISRMVGGLLDVYDLIPESYHLEVSSPGLTRPLKKPEDFQRYAGRLVRITTHHALEGKQVFRGILQGLEGDAVCLQDGETVHRLPLPEIAKARLDLDLKNNLKGDKDLS
jgi:ribosome maturation factor RimP